MTPSLLRTAAVASVLTLSLAACDRNAPAEAPPAAETPPEAQAAAAPQGGFAGIESRMKEAMMAARGQDAGETWARKMIPHHQGAIDMSRAVLGTTQDADIRRMAQKTVDMQTQDIADLERWLERQAPPAGAAAAGGNPFQAAEDKMHQAMMAASGEGDVLWARKMIPHHQGAADLSRIVLEQSQDPTVRQKAQKVIDDAQKDIRELEAWLSKHGG